MDAPQQNYRGGWNIKAGASQDDRQISNEDGVKKKKKDYFYYYYYRRKNTHAIEYFNTINKSKNNNYFLLKRTYRLNSNYPNIALNEAVADCGSERG